MKLRRSKPDRMRFRTEISFATGSLPWHYKLFCLTPEGSWHKVAQGEHSSFAFCKDEAKRSAADYQAGKKVVDGIQIEEFEI